MCIIIAKVYGRGGRWSSKGEKMCFSFSWTGFFLHFVSYFLLFFSFCLHWLFVRTGRMIIWNSIFMLYVGSSRLVGWDDLYLAIDMSFSRWVILSICVDSFFLSLLSLRVFYFMSLLSIPIFPFVDAVRRRFIYCTWWWYQ